MWSIKTLIIFFGSKFFLMSEGAWCLILSLFSLFGNSMMMPINSFKCTSRMISLFIARLAMICIVLNDVFWEIENRYILQLKRIAISNKVSNR